MVVFAGVCILAQAALTAPVLVVVPASSAGGFPATPPIPLVSPLTVEQVYTLLQTEPGQCTLVDIRTAEAYASEHIAVPGVETMNLPESVLEQRYRELERTKKVIVYDQSGRESRATGEKFVELGFDAVYIMLGGFDEWKQQYPTTGLNGPTATPTAAAPTPPLPIFTNSFEPEPTPEHEFTPAPGTSIPVPTGTHPASPTTAPWLPGFELSCAILGLLAIAVLILNYRRRV
jgi:rhodanese-related sulfurtransferase